MKGVLYIIRVFDAFAGIGGFRSGLEKAGGFKFVGWCEIDKYAQKAYRAVYDTGGEEFYENIRDIDTGELADFDLLTGGFPCQPFSVAGQRKGFCDERGDLFFELARLLKDKRPRYFIFENVPGLLGIEKGQTFAKILDTLSELGYCVEWLVHDSSGFGVPQARKRVYLAGCLGADCSGKILCFGTADEENSRKVRQLIGGIAIISAKITIKKTFVKMLLFIFIRHKQVLNQFFKNDGQPDAETVRTVQAPKGYTH